MINSAEEEIYSNFLFSKDENVYNNLLILPSTEDNMNIHAFNSLVEKLKEHISIFGIWPIEIIKKNMSFFFELLSLDEKTLCDKYNKEKNRLEFLGGRILLKLCINKFLDHKANSISDFTKITIRKETDGSPSIYFNDNKINSASYSISHKDKYIFCAVDSIYRIGIDVEKVDKRLIKLKSKFISQKEEEVIFKAYEDKVLEDCELVHYYTMLWASKESMVKCLKGNLLDLFNRAQLVDIKGNDFFLKYAVKNVEQNYISHNYLYNNFIFSILQTSL